MYIDTVTLFNRYDGKWYPHVLRNVDLNADKAAILERYGDSCNDRATLHIKHVNGKIGGLSVVKQEDYTGDADTMTFAVDGENFSFFINGSYATDIIDDDDYTDGFFNYMNETNSEVYRVSSYARYSVIPHYEVMGK